MLICYIKKEVFSGYFSLVFFMERTIIKIPLLLSISAPSLTD